MSHTDNILLKEGISSCCIQFMTCLCKFKCLYADAQEITEIKNKKGRQSVARKSGNVQYLDWAPENSLKIYPKFVQHSFSILWSEKAEKCPVVAYICFLRAKNLTLQCFCLCMCMSSCLYFEKTCIVLYGCNKREKNIGHSLGATCE